MQVERWTTDTNELGGIEVQQAGAVSVHRSLAGHEHPVVSLRDVARHALLVALAMVDVHMEHPSIDERLEVARRVVAVQDNLRAQLGVQERQLRERRR